MGIHFSPILLHNQGYPKVCPDPLNLLNAGDPFCWNIIVIFLFSVYLDQGLNCFDLEGSRVFSVKFPRAFFIFKSVNFYISYKFVGNS
jgi:hypothetical protein